MNTIELSSISPVKAFAIVVAGGALAALLIYMYDSTIAPAINGLTTKAAK